ncbi:MAG: hypothetical protein HYZ47_05000 [Simkania negevensis]|nr:hypothetical protein [Simkania negevensis]
MYYKSFLFLLSQLLTSRKGKIFLEEHEIFVEKNFSKNVWVLKGKIAPSQSFILLDSLSPAGKLRLESAQLYIEKDPGSKELFLVQEIPTPKTFLAYKKGMEGFLSYLALWAEDKEEAIY